MSGVMEPAIKVGEKWEQLVISRKGERKIRVVEITGRPTLSSPVNYRIVRNDLHPHRAGKTSSTTRSELRRKYRHVG